MLHVASVILNVFESLAAIEKLCGPPPKVEDAIVMCDYQKEYLSETEVQYKCRHEYKMGAEDKIKCKNGEWEKKDITCIGEYWLFQTAFNIRLAIVNDAMIF